MLNRRAYYGNVNLHGLLAGSDGRHLDLTTLVYNVIGYEKGNAQSGVNIMN